MDVALQIVAEALWRRGQPGVLGQMRGVGIVNGTPPTVTVVWALTVVTPVIAEDSPIVQEPVPPAVVHGFVVVNAPGPLSIVKLIVVPSGAFTKPPVPVLTFTCAVKVCV